ncbi:hypothetical protein BKA93DRAFT_724946 [Sparassis latifolia]
MPWPNRVLAQFALVPPNSRENEYYGPYNKLLNYLFPPDSPYTVVPQYLQPASAKGIEYVVLFEIVVENRPIFILEVKEPVDLEYVSARESADDQIRHCIEDLVGRCPIPTLHAVSAMGTRLCFYRQDTGPGAGPILPIGIARHPERVNDVARAERWDCDILDPEGEARFRAVVEEIKVGCVDLA